MDNKRTGKRVLRRPIAGLVLTTLLALVLVGTAAIVVARMIAEESALGEATRVATTLQNVLFDPLLPKIVAGDPATINGLDESIATRRRGGALTGVNIWTSGGTLLYSDNRQLIGRRFDPPAGVNQATNGVTTAKLSMPGDADRFTTRNTDDLVKVYVPAVGPDGQRLTIEVSTPDNRVTAAKAQLVGQLVPFALLSLLLVVVVQLPVAVWLIRRVARGQEENSRLLRSALTASHRERSAIARDLHDGVVQDLAGVSYALEAATTSLPVDTPPHARKLMTKATDVMQRSIGSLRTLMVDIYPPHLDGEGMPRAIEDLAGRLRDFGLEVDVDVELTTPLAPEVAATIYRCARECVTNIGKHANASKASIELTGAHGQVHLKISDNGTGLPAGVFDQPPDGHIGLQLLRDSLIDLGGSMSARAGSPTGTEIVVDLPTSVPSRPA